MLAWICVLTLCVCALLLLLHQAALADRDFSAERGQAIVIKAGTSNIPSSAQEAARTEEERRHAEEENRGKLCVPRRPPWNNKMTADQLDAQERSYFLEWRRGLAELESSDCLVLTPFEKNLNVWRQLWRVLERSDIVVQVVDARDPLTYWNEDLQKYCLEMSPTKTSILLMNKSDMVPEKLRSVWADYFDSRKIDYLFWSAKSASDIGEDDKPDDRFLCKDDRVRLCRIEELMEKLEEKARQAVKEQELLGLPRGPTEQLVVGLIGYPNVGKSSTINALFGSKKTAVAATPGKTKHFQTLLVSDSLCLCDCPGLVMPRFARSKADMVAAGVIPIDRLTDVIEPVEIIASRVKKEQLEDVYGIILTESSANHVAFPLARSLLYRIAASRGWSSSGGLPDMTRAGRRVLKDYVDGKVLACKAPPNASVDIQIVARDAYPVGVEPRKALPVNTTSKPGEQAQGEKESIIDDDLDSFFTESMPNKPLRPSYKFHKKTKAKSRGATVYSAQGAEEMSFGKKGGLKR